MAAALSLFFLFNLVRNGSAITDDILTEIQITAHRGSSKSAPENTMAAMELAVENMADFVEIDVQETADGVVVLGHDSTLKRVAGVNRTIGSYTLNDLRIWMWANGFPGSLKGRGFRRLQRLWLLQGPVR